MAQQPRTMPQDNNDLYATLGVSESASAEEVRKAFHARALRCHPDKGGDARAFQELQAAYATLGDANSRCAYDAKMRMERAGLFGGSEEEACGFGCFAAAAAAFGRGRGGKAGKRAGYDDDEDEDDDVFETVFDASDPFCGPAFVFATSSAASCSEDDDRDPPSPPPPPSAAGAGADAPVSVHLPLEHIRQGCPALPVEVQVSEECPSCSARRPCPACSGTGTRLHVLGSTLAIRAPCTACSGSGVRNRGRLGCARCSDAGHVVRDRRVSVRVPPGLRDGHVVPLEVVVPSSPPDDNNNNNDNDVVWVRVTYAPARGESVVPDGSGDVVVRVPLLLGETLTGRFREGDVKTVTAMGRQIRLMAPRAYRDPTIPVVLPGRGLPAAVSVAASERERHNQPRYGDLRLVFDVQWPCSSSSSARPDHDKNSQRVVRNLNKYADVLGRICGLPGGERVVPKATTAA